MGGALFLVLLGASCSALPADQRIVVFDESRDALFSIHDPGFMGYSAAASSLRERGYTVWASTEPLAQFVLGRRQARDYVLVLGLHRTGRMPEADQAAVLGFLRAGGAALVLAEHDDAYGSADAANLLARGAGIQVSSGAALGVANPALSSGSVTVARAARWGLDSVLLYYAAPVAVTGLSTRILAAGADGTPIAVLVRVGRGRLAVVGDAEFIWNGGPAFGLNAGDNRAFLLRVVDLLHGSSIHRWPSRTYAPAPSALAPTVAWDDRQDPRMGQDPDGYGQLLAELDRRGIPVTRTSDSAALNRATTILVAEPTRPLPFEVRDDQRLIVLLTATSSITTPLGSTPLVRTLARFASQAAPPLEQVLQRRGIIVDQAGLRGPGGEFTIYAPPESRSRACPWTRPAVVRVGREATILTEAVGHPDASVLMLTDGHGRPLRVNGLAQLAAWPLIVESPRTLVLTAGTSLRNDVSRLGCFSEVARVVSRWLKPSRLQAPAEAHTFTVAGRR